MNGEDYQVLDLYPCVMYKNFPLALYFMYSQSAGFLSSNQFTQYLGMAATGHATQGLVYTSISALINDDKGVGWLSGLGV